MSGNDPDEIEWRGSLNFNPGPKKPPNLPKPENVQAAQKPNLFEWLAGKTKHVCTKECQEAGSIKAIECSFLNKDK